MWKPSQPVNSSRPFFMRGAYTDSNNGPGQEQGLAAQD